MLEMQELGPTKDLLRSTTGIDHEQKITTFCRNCGESILSAHKTQHLELALCTKGVPNGT